MLASKNKMKKSMKAFTLQLRRSLKTQKKIKETNNLEKNTLTVKKLEKSRRHHPYKNLKKYYHVMSLYSKLTDRSFNLC